MNQSHRPGDNALSNTNTDFFGRSPSVSWECFSLMDSPQKFIWVWFKPPNLPQGFVVRIPDETFGQASQANLLSMRKLLEAVGLDPSLVSMWSLYGAPVDGQNGTSSYFDQAICKPAAGIEPEIVVYLDSALMVPAPPTETVQLSAAVTAAETGDSANVFARIDADWNASLRIEKQLAIARKQLAAMVVRINSLNRELTPEERVHADRNDLTDWQETKRWLRDVATRLARFMKEHDVGEASTAGKRNWFEQTHRQYIVPRQQFDGLQQVQRDYESYRKTLQTLLTNMNNSYSKAVQDGEQRAMQVLSRIGAKVRKARTKR